MRWLAFFWGCWLSTLSTPSLSAPAPVASYKIINTFPHDIFAFTQGLGFSNGLLFEGTGLNGQSEIRKVDLSSGQVLQRQSLSEHYFGEGITVWDDQIFQITWLSKKGFVYDKNSFERKAEFSYHGQGWGLTHDDHHLILSDGSPFLRFIDPNSFEEIKRVEVKDQGEPIRFLNELEFVNGEIYANIWFRDKIACISPQTGEVTRWIDLDLLLIPKGNPNEIPGVGNVLNGIAYDKVHDRLFVTGKYWPSIFEIQVVPSQNSKQ